MNASGMAIIDIIFNIISGLLIKWCHSAERFNTSRPLQQNFAPAVWANFWIYSSIIGFSSRYFYSLLKEIANMVLIWIEFFYKSANITDTMMIDSLLLFITVYSPGSCITTWQVGAAWDQVLCSKTPSSSQFSSEPKGTHQNWKFCTNPPHTLGDWLNISESINIFLIARQTWILYD